MHGISTRSKQHLLRIRRWACYCTLAGVFVIGAQGCLGGGDEPTGPETPTGSLNGRVTEPESGAPIAGAVVTLTSIGGQKVVVAATFSTTTDANGEYWFTGLEPGDYSLNVDASGIVVDPSNTDLEYVGYTVDVEVGEDATVVDAGLPVVDISQNVPVEPGTATILEPADIPGLRIEIDADAATFPDGSATGELNVVQLGFNDGPMPLPQGFAPAMMIKIVPEGTTFDPPARIQFPNRDELPAGRAMEMFFFDGTADQWASDGGATSMGDVVSSDTGGGIDVASTHFVVCDAHTVSGSIFDQFQVGVDGAHVALWAWVNPFGNGGDFVELEDSSGMTDATGTFSIAGVRACNVSIGAVIEEAGAFGEIEPLDPVQTDGSGTTVLPAREMNVVSQTMFSVVGVVRNIDGSAVAGAFVSMFDPNGSGTAEMPATQANAFGAYELVEIVADPGQELGIYANDESTGIGNDARFIVPPLSGSGSTLTVDITICERTRFAPCGERGNWSLTGTTLNITSYESNCGTIVEEQQTGTVISLVDGVLTLDILEHEVVERLTFTRVRGSGPSGVSAANLVGIYDASWDNAMLALYADGTFTWLSADEEFGTLQSGTYTSTGTQLNAVFGMSTDPQMPPGNYTFDYTLTANTLTFDDPTDPDVFERCEYGPNDGIEGNWNVAGDGPFNLILYRGEFAGVGYDAP